MFAARQRFLGLRGRDGTASSRAWETFALDLDGENTTSDKARGLVGVCRPTTKDAFAVDGAKGVDDAFATIVKTLSAGRSDLEQAADAATAAGVSTWVLVLDDVGGDDDARAPGHLYVAGAPTARPTFGPTDHWTLGPGVDFPEGYVSAGTWVSGPPHEVALPVDWFGPPTTWSVDTIVSVSLGDGHGTLVGVVRVEALRTAMGAALGSSKLCPSDPTFASVLASVEAAPDLVYHAPRLQDPGRTCDAVSLAIGFQLAETGEPRTGWTPPPVPPCE